MIEEFSIFERNKVSIEIKLTAIAMYLLSSSLRRITLLLNVGNQLYITGSTYSRMFLTLKEKRKKIVHLKVYPVRNALNAYSFLK